MTEEQIKFIVNEFRAEGGKIRSFWKDVGTTTNINTSKKSDQVDQNPPFNWVFCA